MKIRVGYGLGTRSNSNAPDRLNPLIDGLEAHGFDSLWFSERINGSCPDPLVAMSYAAARTTKLKLGMSVMVLPGRNPVVLAKSLASLDQVSGGRLLPAFGLGVADSAEHQAFGVDRKDRGRWFNEALPLMKRLWTEDQVSHAGPRFTIENVTVKPQPTQTPLEVWLGGISPLELKRVGRHADGWLPSFCTPQQVDQARVIIEKHATEFDREIEDEHYGALISYRHGGAEIHESIRAHIATRHPDVQAEAIIPTLEKLDETLQSFIDVGFSKFVVVPAAEPDDWNGHLSDVADVVKPLEN